MAKKLKATKKETPIWDVPLKDLKKETKRRVKRKITKVKKDISESTLKDIAKTSVETAVGPVGTHIYKKIKKKLSTKKYKDKGSKAMEGIGQDIKNENLKKGKKDGKRRAPNKKTMGGMKKMYQSGGFLEPKTPNLDEI